ncbi:MAG: AzlC-like protein [Burkholderiaceae bacterium]|nr:AzlC-like protein [Burkholderiaceae bacterium]
MQSECSKDPLSPLMLTMPVAMGYIPLGMVFGFLFVSAGGQWWAAIALSVLVFAGAAQYAAIPMMAAGMSMGAIALATAVINLRHVFYGLSLIDRFPRNGWYRWYMVFGLTDETYSVLTTLPKDTVPIKMLSVTALNHLWWIAGTALGALMGSQVKIPLVGLDFVLSCLFAVLMVEQWRNRLFSSPLWSAMLAYVAASLLSASHALDIAIGLCVLASFFVKHRQEHRVNV